MINDITFEFVKLSDIRYQTIRNNHYVDNNGCHGQQIHFLIHYNNSIIGIISGASSVYGVKDRDEFFKIPKDKNKKEKIYLPAIINNTVFRLEYHEKNLATRILSKWRHIVSILWEELYNIQVIGFETFVVEEDWRKGTLYKADNWTNVGITRGSTKKHNGLINKSERIKTNTKLIFCKWNSKKPIIPTKEYISCWKNKTLEEKQQSKHLQITRNRLYNKIY